MAGGLGVLLGVLSCMLYFRIEKFCVIVNNNLGKTVCCTPLIAHHLDLVDFCTVY